MSEKGNEAIVAEQDKTVQSPMHQRIVIASVAVVVLLLSVLCWLGGSSEYSDTERRPLAKLPELSGDAVSSGDFMEGFEAYAQDQFPFREAFRTVSAVFDRGVLRRTDDNGLYIKDGYIAQQQLTLRPKMLARAAEHMNAIYDRYLADTGVSVYIAIIPDKYYYMSGKYECPSMDYGQLFDYMRGALDDMTYIDITDLLSLEDYYRTDTHWRQESVLDVAGRLADAMGADAGGNFDYHVLDQPFYGVYYGQAALPLEPDTITYLTDEALEACTVTSYNTGLAREAAVYDMDKAAGKDAYEMYLGGSDALLTIDNPMADTDRELVIFRDSYGSSLAPLLVCGYRKVTLVDVRYIQDAIIGSFVDFDEQDVLFLYSTLVLNNG